MKRKIFTSSGYHDTGDHIDTVYVFLNLIFSVMVMILKFVSSQYSQIYNLK